ncbi:MAG: Rieske (2Fe-2S) protein [Myxococcota bacterium]
MSDDPTRRQFLRRSAGTVGAVGLVSLCGGCAWFHKQDMQVEAPPKADSVALSLTQYPKLASPGGAVLVEGKDGDVRVRVLRKADGSLVALSLECTHWGCDIDWKAQKNELECPCHGSRFDTDGKVLEGPADAPLTRYPVSEADGVVTVQLTRAPG